MSNWLFAILVSCGGIAALAALAWLRRGNIARGLSRAAAATAVDDYRRTRDKADLGLICPVCRGAAEPMCDTRDEYRCVQCGHLFADAPHLWTNR
ncbi:MAG: hypothetical protein HY290_23500 [Planctomycetia bacterium]|nr:hypothetical protein [Planctomycetia bacterium]